MKACEKSFHDISGHLHKSQWLQVCHGLSVHETRLAAGSRMREEGWRRGRGETEVAEAFGESRC